MRFYFDFGPNSSYRYPRYSCFDFKKNNSLQSSLTKLSIRDTHLAHSIVVITDKGPEWIKNRYRSLGKGNLLLTDDELKDFTWQVLQSTTFYK